MRVYAVVMCHAGFFVMTDVRTLKREGIKPTQNWGIWEISASYLIILVFELYSINLKMQSSMKIVILVEFVFFGMNVPLCRTWLLVFPRSNRDSLPNQEFVSNVYHLKVEVKSRKLRATLTHTTRAPHYSVPYRYSFCLTKFLPYCHVWFKFQKLN